MTEIPIRELAGVHVGESLAILGNGWSLNEHRERLARGLPCRTFGLNRSWLYCDADYHTSNDRVHRNEIDRGWYRPRFLFVGPAHKVPEGIRGARYDQIPHRSRGRGLIPVFSMDASRGICAGVTPFVALQLGWWLGFREFFLLGIDLKPGPEGQGHFYDGLSWEELGRTRDEIKALGFPGGQPPWYRAPMFPYMPKQQIPEFLEAKKVLDREGAKVWNLSADSALRIFPFAKAEDVFGS